MILYELIISFNLSSSEQKKYYPVLFQAPLKKILYSTFIKQIPKTIITMTENYTERQKKIYSDYYDYSTDRLIEIVESKKLVNSVIEIVEDILVERDVISNDDRLGEKASQRKEIEETERIKQEVFNKQELAKRQKEVLFFVEKFKNNTNEDIAEIISKYKNYKLASVEAALIISRQRGSISDEEKEKLLSQMEKFFLSKNVEHEVKNQKEKEDAKKDMIFGALWVIGGIIATTADFGYIFWGAIVFGGFQFIRGLVGSF